VANVENLDVIVMADLPDSTLKDAFLIVRRSGSGTAESYYALRTNNGSSKNSPNVIERMKNGFSTILVSDTTDPLPNLVGQYWLRFQVYNEGENVVLNAMWWPVSSEMPTDWNLSVIDTDSSKITGGGSVGLAGWVASTFYFDNYQVYPHYVCSGTIPANATLCKGIDTGLSADTPWAVVSSPWDGISNDCTGAQCEYRCNEGYFKDGNTCKSFNDFGFAYRVKTQWYQGNTGDLYDLHISNPDGQNTYDGTQKDDVKSGGDYSQGYEDVILSKSYDEDSNGIDTGNYNVWIRENNDHNFLLSDNCTGGNLTAYVYAFDMTTPVLSYPCVFVSNSSDLNAWFILHITMPSGLVEAGNL
jgi:hypothetical protein